MRMMKQWALEGFACTSEDQHMRLPNRHDPSDPEYMPADRIESFEVLEGLIDRVAATRLQRRHDARGRPAKRQRQT